MRSIRRIIAALGLVSLAWMLPVAPLGAQPVEVRLAGIFTLLTGRWTGEVEGINPESGLPFLEEDSFNYAVISDDGLDTVLWSEHGLILRQHLDGPNYHSRTYGQEGPGFEEDLRYQVLSGPVQGEASWRVTAFLEQDGRRTEIRETYTLKGRGLQMEAEQGEPGGSFERIARGRWERDETP